MADETLVEALVEALAKAVVPSREADDVLWNDYGHLTNGHAIRQVIAIDAPALLPLLVAHATAAERAALLRTLLEEPDLLWPDDNAECGMPSVSEAADWCEMDAGDVKAFDVAKTLGKRWIAMLPTDLERDDGYADGIGWLDGEAVLFDSLEEADQAMFARKASLLAPEAR